MCQNGVIKISVQEAPYMALGSRERVAFNFSLWHPAQKRPFFDFEVSSRLVGGQP